MVVICILLHFYTVALCGHPFLCIVAVYKVFDQNATNKTLPLTIKVNICQNKESFKYTFCYLIPSLSGIATMFWCSGAIFEICLNNPTSLRNSGKFSDAHLYGSFVLGPLPSLPPFRYATASIATASIATTWT